MGSHTRYTIMVTPDNIVRIMRVTAHCAQCCDGSACAMGACRRWTVAQQHAAECVEKRCRICRLVNASLMIHARYCDVPSGCLVPKCASLKALQRRKAAAKAEAREPPAPPTPPIGMPVRPRGCV